MANRQPFKYVPLKSLNKKSREDLISEIKQLQNQLKFKGTKIGNLYYLVKDLIENHPHNFQLNQSNVPQNEGNDAMKESLQKELTKARDQIKNLMQYAQKNGGGSINNSNDDNGKKEITDSEEKGEFQKSMECPICMVAYSGEKRAVALNCGHVYCEECLLKHQEGKFQATCPFCRKPFSSFLPLYFN